MASGSLDGVLEEIPCCGGIEGGRDDAADDEQGGSGERGEIREGGDGGGVLRLTGARGFRENEDGRIGRNGGVLQPVRDFGIVGAGHVDDDRGFGGDADAGEELGFGRAGEGREENVGRQAAIGEGEFCGGGGGKGGGDAGNDFKRDVGSAQGFDFFGGAAKEERVATFEADDDFVLTGGVEEKRVNVLLGEEAEAGAFADVDALGGGGDEIEDFRRDERVVEDDAGRLKQAEGLDGEEAGIARACADQVDLWGWDLGGEVASGRGGWNQIGPGSDRNPICVGGRRSTGWSLWHLSLQIEALEHQEAPSEMIGTEVSRRKRSNMGRLARAWSQRLEVSGSTEGD